LIVAQRLRITRPLVCIDLETTGTVPGVDRAIQIGVMKAYPEVDGANECPGGSVSEWSSFIDPQLAIPAEATLKHKISNEMVVGAPTFRDLAGRLAIGLTGCDFVGQNVKFDLRFLEAEFARVGRAWSYEDAKIIDTKRIDEVLSPRTLEALVEKYLKEQITNAHEALSDVRWTAKVLARMLEDYPQLPQTVDEFHALLFPRDTSWVDKAGKIVWRNQEACFGFGKWNGVPLKNVPKDYLAWIQGQDFPDDVKAIVRDALQNTFPIRAIAETEQQEAA
jgi:DNA polymerase-3 subunit epsilon